MSSDLNSKILKTQDLADVNLSKKMNSLYEVFALKLAKLDRDLDLKIENSNPSLSEATVKVVKTFLFSKEGVQMVSSVTNDLLEKKELDLTAGSPLSCKIYDTCSSISTAFRGEVLTLIEQLKSAQKEFTQELSVMKDSLNAFTGVKESDFEQVPSQLKNLNLYGKKIDRLTVWFESLQQQHLAKSKSLSAMDVKMRKSNLIFD